MTIQFYKYQGTGNDFIILDNRNNRYDGLSPQQVAFLCDRRFGIGADGLMLLNAHPSYDFEMKYYNSDGNAGSMCGNGGRCITKFAQDMGLVQTTYTFLAVDGAHEASIGMDGKVSLKMQDVSGIAEEDGHYVLDTGSPHYVVFETGVMQLDVFNKGREIRYSSAFRDKGINVNFIGYNDLITVKQKAARPQDIADVDKLKKRNKKDK